MHTSLRQVAEKSKVSTLPGDLKKIAEEMLSDKFGVKEEAPQRADSFQPPHGHGSYGPKSRMGYRRYEDYGPHGSATRRSGTPLSDRRLVEHLIERSLQVREEYGVLQVEARIRCYDVIRMAFVEFSPRMVINVMLADMGRSAAMHAAVKYLTEQFYSEANRYDGPLEIDY